MYFKDMYGGHCTYTGKEYRQWTQPVHITVKARFWKGNIVQRCLDILCFDILVEWQRESAKKVIFLKWL